MSTVGGYEERSPEPKPRWNPKPEQIRILEAIFNSGMVNPPRDEIRKIRAQLQEYGQVGDANVFYWFQNRKSRSKHKLRHLQNSKQQTSTPIAAAATAPSSSSSSSSEKSSPKAPIRPFSMGFSNLVTEANINNNLNSSTSPTASVNQTIFQTNNREFFADQPFFFPAVHQSSCSSTSTTTQGFCFPTHNHELSTHEVLLPHEVQNMGPCTSLLLSEIMNHHHPHHGAPSSKKDHLHEQNYNKVLMKMDDPHDLNYTSLTPQTPSLAATPINVVVSSHHATSGTTTVSAPSVTVHQVQGNFKKNEKKKKVMKPKLEIEILFGCASYLHI